MGPPKKTQRKAKPEKKQKKVKDPNAPKRPMSAYFLFMNSVRPEVRKENPEATIGDIAKIMGKMWGEIGADKKAKFDKDAAAAKKKWEMEKAAYEKKPKPAESEEEEEEDSD